MARRTAAAPADSARLPGDWLMLSDVPWLSAPRERLLVARREGRLPHALLVHGPDGGGQLPFGLWLAQWMLCDRPATAACGACSSCQLFLAGNHPDFHWLGIDEDATAIKVDQIRALCQQLALRSYRGAAKVGLIEPAERMNTSSFNALLKTLEEPPDDTILILAASRLDRLPATILSRCQRIHIVQPAPAEGIAWLEGHDRRADWPALLAMAGGAPIKALSLVRSGVGELVADLEQAFGPAAAGRLDAFSLAADWAKDRPAERLAWLESWLERQIRHAAGVGDAVNNNRDNALPRPAHALNMTIAFALLDRLRDARLLLEGSLNTQLLLEDLLTAFGEALAGRPVPAVVPRD